MELNLNKCHTNSAALVSWYQICVCRGWGSCPGPVAVPVWRVGVVVPRVGVPGPVVPVPVPGGGAGGASDKPCESKRVSFVGFFKVQLLKKI
nr:hypothetical protein [Tanacetum cinerariifolium]